MACNLGNCYGGGYYNPSASSCYPNTNFLCSQPQTCNQTVFRNGTPNCCNNNTVSVSGNFFSSHTSFQINGSGLSIVGTTGTKTNTATVATAGVICGCPTNFTTTIFTTNLSNSTTGVGCINWCVCGCNVLANGTFTQSSSQGNVCINGTACTACGTRTICISKINITT